MGVDEFQSRLFNIIRNYIEKKKYRVAIPELEKLEDEYGQTARTSYYLGLSYANTGELRRAIDKLELALKFVDLPLTLQIHTRLLLGYLYVEFKEYDKAEIFIKEAIEMNPHSSSAYSVLGYVYYELKKYDLAIYNFKRAIQIDPNNASAHNNLGYTYLELGINLSEALNECKKAVALNPRSAVYHDSLGWAYYMLGNYKAAVNELEKALDYPCRDKEVILEHYKKAIQKRDRLS